ncbi:phosphoribosylformylglycinamidine synthase I [Patescibacteria group bacterium]|nr:phosphoribosylformylglycinamidine synthase I [Patescibacteria group bacterium]MBU0963894.1 phosphoribosylformylglycinamidine synthase I [Patescibacteria group bacterium]
MISKPKIAILTTPGTNCHEETAYAVEQAGGQAEILLIRYLLEGVQKIVDYQSLIIPGGFSWGDHIAAGRVAGVHLIARLREQIQILLDRNAPIAGICNGFQILSETGLLPNRELGVRSLALLQNLSARFESRKVRLKFPQSGCIWTQGLADRTLVMPIPVAHAEGRLSRSDGIIPACYYIDEQEEATGDYPGNPNGSPEGIAGITDETGLIFGLMPHPERAVEEWHCSTDGRLIFSSLISFLNQS